MSADIQLTSPPTDTVSDIKWSPVSDFISISSWDNSTKIYQISPNGTSVGKSIINHDAPALCTAWSKDGSKVFSGACDKVGKLMDMNTLQTTQVAAHDAPIKSCRFIDDVGGMNNMIVTGSWDKTAKYWDLRSPNPAHTLALPERCYSLDVKGPLMVIATAERHLMVYNLNNPSTLFKKFVSPLSGCTRVVSCFNACNGFAIGAIEGRCAIQYVEDKDTSLNFSFKCHREDKNVYAVNDISFHPTYGTFSTAGGDGCFNFWDKDSKQRLKSGTSAGSPITSTSFNRNGTIFSYGVGYDWSKGHEHSQPGGKFSVFLHPVKDEEIKPKPLSLVQLSFLSDAKPEQQTLAREILEIGAFYSVKVKDIPAFERFISQLKVYYYDFRASMPSSTRMYTLLGLDLLRLLSQNRISEFHTELERLDPEERLNLFIKHPIQLEQCLMEGSFNKVWNCRENVPAEEYLFFIDILMGTIRNEIADCSEKAYASLPLTDAATLLYFKKPEEALEFFKKREWKIEQNKILFNTTSSNQDEIPTHKMIIQCLDYAKELERII